MKNHILTIPLYNDSEKIFIKKLEKKFSNEIKDFYTQPDYHDKAMIFDLLKAHFNSRYPSVHKYNNILGYSELVVDGNDILIYFYLNGDRRKIYNKNIKWRNNRNGIYYPTNHIYGGTIKNRNNKEIQKALQNAFAVIENQCKKWKVYLNLEYERKIIKHFDFQSYFKENNIGRITNVLHNTRFK